MPKLWMFWYLVMVAVFVRAETPTNSASDTETNTAADHATRSHAFWDYFIEYGGVQGELFDPLDLAEVEQTKAHQTDADEDNEEPQP